VPLRAASIKALQGFRVKNRYRLKLDRDGIPVTEECGIRQLRYGTRM
jgi:hypothetical protein